jgi:hypothetical protein
MPETIFTQQFQTLFAKAKGKPGTVVMQLSLLNGSTVVQELTSTRALPEDMGTLKEKAMKVVPKQGVSTIKFINCYLTQETSQQGQ